MSARLAQPRSLGEAASGWPGLVLLDAAAAATFARCFDSPSELWLLVPVCVGAQVIAHSARLASRRGWQLSAFFGWLLAVIFVFWVPLLALDLGRLRFGLPVGHGASVLSSQLNQAWHIFSTQVSPVSTATGLVLAAAWACGLVGLAAEALDSDGTLPAVVALVPAFDVVVFTGTLGTTTGRALELAGVGAFAVWYLAGSAFSTRRARRAQTVVARVEETASSVAVRRRRGLAGMRVAAPGLVVVAAVGAGVVGPLLPGATSQALVNWHGGAGKGHNGNGTGGGSGGSKGGPVTISSLVRVGEEEVDNSNIPLITVHSSVLTREVLTLLEAFNGNEWSPANVNAAPIELPTLGGTVAALAQKPPPVTYVGGHALLSQVITIDQLGGSELPVPGTPLAASGVGVALERTESGPVAVDGTLHRGETYAVQAFLNPAPPQTRSSKSRVGVTSAPPGSPPTSIDLSLPQPVPQLLVNLADAIVAGATTPQQKAFLIQSYLADNPQFRYALPTHQPSGAIADTGEGYTALEAFLFRDRVGYCQQFASAFAVLARIVGLPTRIAVGLLPGPALANDEWVVTGQQVHAWPQVYFPGVGWSDYEPTPSTPAPPTFPVGGSGSGKPPTTGKSGGAKASNPPPHRVNSSPSTTSAIPALPPVVRVRPLSTGGGGPSPFEILLVIVGLGVAGALAVPGVRLLLLRKRRRDPSTGVVSYWSDSLRVLAAAGYHRKRAETFNEFVQRVRVAGVLSQEGDAALRRLVLDVNRARFSLDRLSPDDVRRATTDARIVRRAAWRVIPRWHRLLVEVDPRSLRPVL